MCDNPSKALEGVVGVCCGEEWDVGILLEQTLLICPNV